MEEGPTGKYLIDWVAEQEEQRAQAGQIAAEQPH